nr:hypothetical protein [Mycobacteroides abscessus]
MPTRTSNALVKWLGVEKATLAAISVTVGVVPAASLSARSTSAQYVLIRRRAKRDGESDDMVGLIEDPACRLGDR